MASTFIKLPVEAVADGGVTAMAAVGSSPNANAASISGTTLTMQPASGSFPGVLTTGAQTIAGNKSFSGTLGVGGQTAGTAALSVRATSNSNTEGLCIYAADGLSSTCLFMSNADSFFIRNPDLAFFPFVIDNAGKSSFGSAGSSGPFVEVARAADVAQFGVNAHSTQTSNLAQFKNTAGTIASKVDGSCNFFLNRVMAGTTSAFTNASAGIELQSTTLALLLSRMNNAAESALTAVNGMLIYNSETNKFRAYENGAWADVIGGGSANWWETTLPNLTYILGRNAADDGDINILRVLGNDAIAIGLNAPSVNVSSDAISLNGQNGDIEILTFGGEVRLSSDPEFVDLVPYNYTTAPTLRFSNSDETFRVGIKAPDALAASYNMVWPTAQASGQNFLKNDGSGNLSFEPGFSFEESDLSSTQWGADLPAIVFDGTTAAAAAAFASGIIMKGDDSVSNLVIFTQDQAGALVTSSIFLSSGINSGSAGTGRMDFGTGAATGSAGNSGETGWTTGNSANGDSGNLTIASGAANNGTRGGLNIQVNTINMSSSIGGLTVPNISGSPAALANGMIWYDTGSNLLKARINGATVTITTA